jgi:hypothetical protein
MSRGMKKSTRREGVTMNAKSLVWADTNEPVKAGDLTEGEEFEVEVRTGKVRRTGCPKRKRARDLYLRKMVT